MCHARMAMVAAVISNQTVRHEHQPYQRTFNRMVFQNAQDTAAIVGT